MASSGDDDEPRAAALSTAWAPYRAVAAGVIGALAWLALSSADPGSLVVGIPTVALAALVAGRVGRAPGSRGPGGWAQAVAVPGFVFRLLVDIFSSAWSLAVQVFRPRLDVDPGLVTYQLSITGPEARAAFMNSVTLTPGTLSATLDGSTLTIHALDRRQGVADDLAALEARTAALFGEDLRSGS
ncbi:MAG: Na+/H+ antiporter subunit E [Pseudomonadota bacterium]